MISANLSWIPAAILGIGVLLTAGGDAQRTMALRMPLASAVPSRLDGAVGRDQTVSDEEQRVAGMSSYVLRNYAAASAGGAAAFSVYVGYYESQTRGRTIHSPKNCLPGGGWEPLAVGPVQVATPGGPVVVNRYVLQRGRERALVFYWYQGRGRVAANEYRVKWDLLRDAALRRRSEEALVRVMVPVATTEPEAQRLALRVSGQLVPAVATALPL